MKQLLRRFLRDRQLRRRFREQLRGLPLDELQIRVARTTREYEDAFHLVRIGYTYRGYSSVRGPAMRITEHHVLPEATVLVALEPGACAGETSVVGTVTVTADSPAGLPLDKDFRSELDAMRSQGLRLAEIGSLTVVERCQGRGVTTMLAMAAIWFCKRIAGATRLVIGINPSAEDWYRVIYAFRRFAAARDHAVLTAPVVGVCCDLDELQRFSRRHFPDPLPDGRPLEQHLVETPAACVEMPPSSDLEQLVRWKLPRQVFRELFIEKSDRLSTLDAKTRGQLEGWRTLTTCRNLPAQGGGGR